jgi:hypothetical protein
VKRAGCSSRWELQCGARLRGRKLRVGKMKRIWLVCSIGCLVGAAAALFLRHTDAAFVAAALGAVAWFLDLRSDTKQRVAELSPPDEDDQIEEPDVD